MCLLADEHAIFLLEKAIGFQKDPYVLKRLRDALTDIVGDKESEYNPLEMEAINEMVDSSDAHVKPTWSGKKEEQAMTTSPNTAGRFPSVIRKGRRMPWSMWIISVNSTRPTGRSFERMGSLIQSRIT